MKDVVIALLDIWYASGIEGCEPTYTSQMSERFQGHVVTLNIKPLHHGRPYMNI